MKAIPLVILIITCGIVSAYELSSVQGIDARVQVVGFDSSGNTYAATYKIGDIGLHLNKISSANELIWSIDLPVAAYVQKILITRQDDVYLFLVSAPNILAVVRSNSTNIEELGLFQTSFSYLDSNDNLFYCQDIGVYLLRPETTTPLLIQNLENFYVKWDKTTAVDSDGNIYIVVTDDGYVDNLALISKKSLEEETPQAELFTISNVSTEFVFHTIMDERNDLWIFMSDRTNAVGSILKFSNNAVETILVESCYPDLVGASAKDKIFVLKSRYYFESSPSIYYITVDDDVVDIPEMTNFTVQNNFQSFAVTGNDGSVYFRSYDEFTPELGSIIGFRPGEIQPYPVTLDNPESKATNMVTDFDNNLWIMTDMREIYVFKENEAEAEKILNFNETCDSIDFNLVTKRVYLSCYTGLYFTVD